MTSSNLTWNLIADSTSYVSGMKKAAASTDAMQKASQKAQKQTEVFGKVAGIVGAYAALQFGKKMVNAASNLQETMSKTQVVFGQSADAIIDFSKTSATSLGMSQQMAAEAAATFGNLFVSMKLGQKPAADMSKNLVSLAADLASFNNVDPTVALDALRSGLVGETEPLRKFGVNLNDADLRQRALAMGLTTSTKDVLPPAIKAQAAYALILEQTKTAQGDFARTSDGLANSQRIFAAEVENAEASLGKALLPTVTNVVHALNGMLATFTALPAPVQTAVLAAGALSAGFLLLAPRIVATRAALATMAVESPKAAAALASLGKATAKFALVAAAATAAAHAISAFGDQSVNGGMTTDTLRKKLENLDSGMPDLGFHLSAITTGVYDFNDAISVAADPGITRNIENLFNVFGADTTTSQATKSVQQLDDAIAGLAGDGHIYEAIKQYKKFEDAYVASGGSADEFAKVMVNSANAIGLTGNAAEHSEGPIGKMGDSIADTGKKSAKAKVDVDKYKEAIDRVLGTSLDAHQRSLQWKDSLAALSDMVKENGKSLKENTSAGRANVEGLLDRIKTAQDSAKTDLENGKSLDSVKEKYKGQIQTLRDAAVKAGLNTTAVDALVSAYTTLPTSQTTTLYTNAKAVTRAIKLIAAQWAETVTYIEKHPAMANLHYGLNADGSTPKPKHATGGYITGPGTGTSDSITSRLSNGEFVMRASAVDRYGVSTMSAINSGTYRPASGGGGSVHITAPVVLRMDSHNVWQGLLELRQGRGGTSLRLS